ncbi:MAG TPA: SUMF1/EgtB/PvdO family nonheme iron enzyme [Xanthobacteraceae bacterium]|nr:SUMF1/EgtB/PvdO family nonheme iron enzyme [Xanthobacteraceae bacterium]
MVEETAALHRVAQRGGDFAGSVVEATWFVWDGMRMVQEEPSPGQCITTVYEDAGSDVPLARAEHTYNDVPATYPAFLTRSEAEEVTRLLGGSLPSEEQWEYACRAGTSSLFCFGSKVLSKDQLERWLEWDLSDPNLASNGFGLTGLFFGEWCRDLFTKSYASDAEKLPNAYAIRGGGAYFWPWQDEEWV